MTVFARAARGPRSRFATLQPFRTLLLSWSGRGEAPQLTGAENAEGWQPPLPPAQLMSAFYLNELLLTLTTRHDPHAQLRQGLPAEVPLRQFEARLLDFIGYGLNLAAEADTGQPICAEAHYQYRPGVHGVVRTAADGSGAIAGHVLQGLLSATGLSSEPDLRQARALMRSAIDHCLEGRQLRTRLVARSVSSYSRKQSIV